MTRYPPLEVKLWGQYACFTRPENKVERVSYPVPTPSAMRGTLEAIFWIPEFSWRIREIHVLNEILFTGILRNEVGNIASDRAARSWQKNGGGYYAANDRKQRNSLILKDVAYVVKADIALRPGADADPAKYRDQFRRRVADGQFYHCPYLGCREFIAHFGEPDGNERPLELTEDLGRMVFDLSFDHDKNGRGISGRPFFFEASLKNGVITIPQELYEKTEADYAAASTR